MGRAFLGSWARAFFCCWAESSAESTFWRGSTGDRPIPKFLLWLLETLSRFFLLLRRFLRALLFPCWRTSCELLARLRTCKACSLLAFFKAFFFLRALGSLLARGCASFLPRNLVSDKLLDLSQHPGNRARILCCGASFLRSCLLLYTRIIYPTPC